MRNAQYAVDDFAVMSVTVERLQSNAIQLLGFQEISKAIKHTDIGIRKASPSAEQTCAGYSLGLQLRL